MLILYANIGIRIYFRFLIFLQFKKNEMTILSKVFVTSQHLSLLLLSNLKFSGLLTKNVEFIDFKYQINLYSMRKNMSIGMLNHVLKLFEIRAHLPIKFLIIMTT